MKFDKKAGKFAFIAAVIVVAIAGGVMFAVTVVSDKHAQQRESNQGSVAVEASNDPVSVVDQKDVTSQAAVIFSSLAEFGFQVSPEVRQRGMVASGESFISRKNAYESIRNDLYPGSPIYFKKSDVKNWDNQFESTTLAQYSLEDFDIEFSENYAKVNVDGVFKQAVVADVKVSNRVSVVSSTAGEPGWDGKMEILERSYNWTIQSTFVQDSDGKWRLFDARSMNGNAWTLALNTPEFSTLNMAYRDGNFTNVDQFFEEVPDTNSSDFSELHGVDIPQS